MRQHGVSMVALLMSCVVLIGGALLGMRLAPSYIEFFAIKKAINAIASERSGGSVAEIRKAFDQRATIDDISSVKGSDVEVTKQGGSNVISVTYRKELPLFKGIGIYIDFYAQSKE
jgi:hypothetical protein